MEDKEIIDLMKQDKDEGLQELVKKYGGFVKYVIVNILGNQNRRDIEECLSDVFYEFWMKVEEYDPSKGSLKNYLIGMGRYIALNRYRRISKYQERNILLDEDTIEIHSEEAVESKILESLKSEIINEVILEMKQPDRDIFIRRYFWFEKIKDIAKALNLDSKQVENRLYKGKERLKKQFIEKGAWLD